MKIYHLVRDEDVSGVSGTGIIAEIVEFENDFCVINWTGEAEPRQNFNSLAIYPDLKTIERIHGHGGKTRIFEVAKVSNYD